MDGIAGAWSVGEGVLVALLGSLDEDGVYVWMTRLVWVGV